MADDADQKALSRATIFSHLGLSVLCRQIEGPWFEPLSEPDRRSGFDEPVGRTVQKRNPGAKQKQSRGEREREREKEISNCIPFLREIAREDRVHSLPSSLRYVDHSHSPVSFLVLIRCTSAIRASLSGVCCDLIIEPLCVFLIGDFLF